MRSRSRQARFGRNWSRRNILFGVGAGAAEKSFGSGSERQENHNKMQKVKRENTESIIFIAQFLPFS